MLIISSLDSVLLEKFLDKVMHFLCLSIAIFPFTISNVSLQHVVVHAYIKRQSQFAYILQEK